MKASILHPDCQNLVIKDELGNIIAKSTLYINRNRGYGVFNNIEINNAKINKEYKEFIYIKFIEAINKFIEKYNNKNIDNPLKQINIGMNLNDLNDIIREKNHKSSIRLIGIDFSDFGKQFQSYRGDWQNEQYVIWRNGKSKKNI